MLTPVAELQFENKHVQRQYVCCSLYGSTIALFVEWKLVTASMSVVHAMSCDSGAQKVDCSKLSSWD